ncbi:uncharacterized protein LOC128040010 [Gossypium raimondii]|uniref:uncharacterized protein LOC128040010 n=1 Tax=Gossypium raimondii TaxID=29730 RepID=UPI00227A2BF4|nr:uncharacterized protein LOC128040010 [Gossypium raimondii]
MLRRFQFIDTLNVPEPICLIQRCCSLRNIFHYPFMAFRKIYPALWMWNPAPRIFYIVAAVTV